MCGERIIAQHRVPGLQHIHRADDRQSDKHDKRNLDQQRPKTVKELKPECCGDQHHKREHDEARLKRQ